MSASSWTGTAAGPVSAAFPRKMGHRAGANAFKEIARYANKIGLKYLTAYVFSTENWKRPKDEIDSIIALLRNYLDEMENYRKENIRVLFIGDRTVFDDDIQAKMRRAEEQSRNATGLTLILAINYGGRAEIAQAARRIAEDAASRQTFPRRGRRGGLLPVPLHRRDPGRRPADPPQRRVPA